VATADATYAAVAAFGLTAVTEVLVGVDRWLGLVGGVVLLLLAARALRDAARSPEPAVEAVDAVGAGAADAAWSAPAAGGRPVAGWLTMVGLTLTNPATILSFAALFASIGAGTGGPGGAAATALSVAPDSRVQGSAGCARIPS